MVGARGSQEEWETHERSSLLPLLTLVAIRTEVVAAAFVADPFNVRLRQIGDGPAVVGVTAVRRRLANPFLAARWFALALTGSLMTLIWLVVLHLHSPRPV